MTAIDGTGLHALERFAEVLRGSGRTLLLCGMRDQPARMMERAEFHQHIGDDNMLPSVQAAVARALVLIAGEHSSPRTAEDERVLGQNSDHHRREPAGIRSGR